jgi:hypothetical protein
METKPTPTDKALMNELKAAKKAYAKALAKELRAAKSLNVEAYERATDELIETANKISDIHKAMAAEVVKELTK